MTDKEVENILRNLTPHNWLDASAILKEEGASTEQIRRVGKRLLLKNWCLTFLFAAFLIGFVALLLYLAGRLV